MAQHRTQSDISLRTFIVGLLVVVMGHIIYGTGMKGASVLESGKAFLVTVIATGIFAGVSLRSMWWHPKYAEAALDIKKYPSPKKQILAGFVFIGIVVSIGYFN